jgi:hypothetical protein
MPREMMLMTAIANITSKLIQTLSRSVERSILIKGNNRSGAVSLVVVNQITQSCSTCSR